MSHLNSCFKKNLHRKLVLRVISWLRDGGARVPAAGRSDRRHASMSPQSFGKNKNKQRNPGERRGKLENRTILSFCHPGRELPPASAANIADQQFYVHCVAAWFLCILALRNYNKASSWQIVAHIVNLYTSIFYVFKRILRILCDFWDFFQNFVISFFPCLFKLWADFETGKRQRKNPK